MTVTRVTTVDSKEPGVLVDPAVVREAIVHQWTEAAVVDNFAVVPGERTVVAVVALQAVAVADTVNAPKPKPNNNLEKNALRIRRADIRLTENRRVAPIYDFPPRGQSDKPLENILILV